MLPKFVTANTGTNNKIEEQFFRTDVLSNTA
uniref:Uncharacterized protein n=1 Tax=Rhizophora mucronata TaxID=61149 RepID=A0A2P2N5V3_RHIMU